MADSAATCFVHPATLQGAPDRVALPPDYGDINWGQSLILLIYRVSPKKGYQVSHKFHLSGGSLLNVTWMTRVFLCGFLSVIMSLKMLYLYLSGIIDKLSYIGLKRPHARQHWFSVETYSILVGMFISHKIVMMDTLFESLVHVLQMTLFYFLTQLFVSLPLLSVRH